MHCHLDWVAHACVVAAAFLLGAMCACDLGVLSYHSVASGVTVGAVALQAVVHHSCLLDDPLCGQLPLPGVQCGPTATE